MARNIKKIFFNGEEYPPETFRLAMLLCMVGGFMDTYTFSTRGNVLANAQTGNIVFLAINLGKGHSIILCQYLYLQWEYCFQNLYESNLKNIKFSDGSKL